MLFLCRTVEKKVIAVINAGVSLHFCSARAHSIPAGNCMFEVNNRNTRKKCEICSKLTIKTCERRQWHRFSVFINSEHILHLVLVFLLLTLSR